MDLIHLQADIYIQISHMNIYILSYDCAAGTGGSRPEHLAFSNVFAVDRLVKAETESTM